MAQLLFMLFMFITYYLLIIATHSSAALASKCAVGCTTYGTCNEDLGRCDCPRHRSGAACENNHAAEEASAKEVCKKYSFINDNGPCLKNLTSFGACLNDCNGRGACVGGWCHCRPPYYGADCCLSMSHNGPALLEGLNYTRSVRLPRVVSRSPLSHGRAWPTQLS
jgi:hypothetical protein